MKAALTADMLATDLADYLVRKGVSASLIVSDELSKLIQSDQVPFRETHHISGRAVALAEQLRVPISGLTVQQLQGLCDKFDQDVGEVFNFEASVEKRDAIGGTSKRMVERQIAVFKSLLSL